jgi:hypothetical protein
VPPPLIEAVQQVIAQLDLASLEGVRNVLKFTVGTVVARHGQYFSLIKRACTLTVYCYSRLTGLQAFKALYESANVC